MYLRMTDLLVDLLDRYEPDPGEDEPSDIVTEEPAGVLTYGQWTLLADSPLASAENVTDLVDRLELAKDEEFDLAEGVLAFSADAIAREDLLALIEAVDESCEIIEVSGEIDVHERSLTWMGEGAGLEPMPMPLPRPGDEIRFLVEEVGIHFLRHEAGAIERSGALTTYPAGIEIYGRPYLLLRDEIEDADLLLAALSKAGVPPPLESRVHRLEWDGDVLRASHVYPAVHAVKSLNPAVGFSGGVTWRNDAIRVEEDGDES